MTKSRLPSTGRATGDGDFAVGGAGADPCNGEAGGGVPAAPLEGGPGGVVEPGGAGATLPPGTVHGEGIPLCCPDTAFGLIAGWPLPTATPPNGSPGPALTSGSAGGSFEAGIWLGVPDQTGAGPGEPVCPYTGGGASGAEPPGVSILEGPGGFGPPTVLPTEPRDDGV